MKHFFTATLALLAMTSWAAAATLGDDGLHKETWMRDTFKDLREDLAEATAEGKRFAATSREGALVFNNVMLCAILAIVLLGTLYPLLTEAFDVRVSVGPPYFNPASAIFAVPMFLVMAVGPILRWKDDKPARIQFEAMLIAAVLLFFGTMLSRRLKALRKKATEKKPLQRNNR